MGKDESYKCRTCLDFNLCFTYIRCFKHVSVTYDSRERPRVSGHGVVECTAPVSSTSSPEWTHWMRGLALFGNSNSFAHRR